MPPLSKHHSARTTKLLCIGDTGTAKTGALASLAAAGYNVRILDLDNGVDVLLNLLKSPKSPYPKEAIDNVKYVTIREPMRNVAGKIQPRQAILWQNAMKQLAEWKDTDEDGKEINLGPVTTWGGKDILVIDTLSALSRGAWNFTLAINGKLNSDVSGFESMRMVGYTQKLIEDFLDLIADSSIKCNVIVNSHVTYVRDPGQPKPQNETDHDPIHGYPSAIGKSLSPRIPRVFNSVLLFRVEGLGDYAKRYIYTNTQGIIATKSSAPLNVEKRYNVEDGLAKYFAAVRGE